MRVGHGVLLFVILVACGAPPDAPVDAAVDASFDASTPDTGATTCASSAACDDGVYCNGPETCVAGACRAGASPCAASACDEASDHCSCAISDADHDGAASTACGGTDCDDADPDRYPANTEVCDTTGIDEDCNGASFGSRDTDGDGAIDARCCNHVAGIDTCGTDCNDGAAGVHPTAPEVCNGADDDCDSAIDEAVIVSYASDCDADGFGGGTPIMACAAPASPPTDCPSRPWVTALGDCDDTDAAVHPGATDVCNGADDDCNALLDDATADASCNVHGAGASCVSGACTAATCSGGYLDCDASARGCETDPTLSAAHCGACAHACTYASCAAGLCDMDFVAIDAGNSTTCGLRRNGTIACWGWNFFGQLGDGTTTNRTTPVAVVGITDATAISVGNASTHVCALRAGGTVSCWGANALGQLGDGTLVSRALPVDVPGLSGVVELHTGDAQTCVRTSAGTILCWGNGGAGALGNGASTSSSTPVMVTGIADAIAFDYGGNLGCAIHADHSLSCWGYGMHGELGNGAMVSSPTPVASAVGIGFDRIAVGYDHVCGIATGGGGAYCWGVGTDGQLGDGASTSSAVPVLVGGAVMFPTEIVAGRSHTCVIRGTARALSCWGLNSYGQLGDGTTMTRSLAVQVFGLAGTAQIQTGQWHTCALDANGLVRCWGSNIDGELGDATMTSHPSPAPIVDL